MGTAASMLALTRASVGYLRAGCVGLKWYSSGWTGGSRAAIKTAQLSKLEIVGRAGAILGFAADTYEVINGDIPLSHYGANTAMALIISANAVLKRIRTIADSIWIPLIYNFQ